MIKEGAEANFSPGFAPPEDSSTMHLTEGEIRQPSAIPALSPGQIIADRYRVEFLIGQGAMGAVYSVEQVFLKKRFALKTLNPIIASDIAIRRFQKEAQAASRLEHANLVRAVDFGLIDDLLPFLVMDYVQGPTLAQHLQKVGTLGIEEATKIFVPICFALQYAHREGVVHRDLKPGNIVLVQTGDDEKTFVPSIVDFGIAKLDVGDETEGQALTRTGEVFGTPLYMSPEQCSGKKIDNRSDIYSLGCVLFEALTGAPPFRGESALETMMLHVNDTAPSLAEGSFGREFSGALERIVSKMLAKEPRFRYQGCAEIAADLMKLSESDNDQTTGGVGVSGQKKASSTKIWILAALVLAIVAAGLIAYFHWQNKGGNQTNQPSSAVSPAGEKIATRFWQQEKPEGEFLKPIDKERFSTVKGDVRTFDFGPQLLGTIHWSSQPDFHPDSAAWNARAMRDTVSISAHDFICLEPSVALLTQRPDSLRKFALDDQVVGLIASHKQDNLGYISKSDKQSLGDAMFFANHLKQLRYLDLRKSEATAASLKNLGIEDKSNLTVLKIAYSNIDAAKIPEMALRRLRHFDLSEVPNARTVIKPLAGSPSLQVLVLRSSALTDSDVKAISRLPSLKHLEIQHNAKVTDRGIASLLSLKHLQTLRIQKCGITPAVTDVLAKMQLARLTIYCSGWTKAEIDNLYRQLPHCRIELQGAEGNFALREALE